jgi:hypothetical protein
MANYLAYSGYKVTAGEMEQEIVEKNSSCQGMYL